MQTATPTAVDPRLAAWERRAKPWIVVSAIVPIAAAFIRHEPDDPLTVLDSVTWLVFLVDLVVHLRWRPHYLRTTPGRVDLGIVVLSFPWYVIPGLGASGLLGLARLGRLVRLVIAGADTGLARRLIDRLGKAGLYAAALIAVCSEIVYRVEPSSSGFATRPDALWWGMVTFTTVGYGDLYPTTRAGRLAAVLLMLGGIALIGLLAGSLAELFTGTSDADDDADTSSPDLLLDELRQLRREVAELRAALPGPATEPPR